MSARAHVRGTGMVEVTFAIIVELAVTVGIMLRGSHGLRWRHGAPQQEAHILVSH